MPKDKKDKLVRIALYEKDKKILTELTKKANLTMPQFIKDNIDDLIAQAEKEEQSNVKKNKLL